MATHEDKQKTVMINTRISEELREQFSLLCDEKQQTQAKVLRNLIEEYINNERQKYEQALKEEEDRKEQEKNGLKHEFDFDPENLPYPRMMRKILEKQQ